MSTQAGGDVAGGVEMPPPPTFVIGGESFECVPVVPHWQIMKLAKAYVSDEMQAMAGMIDFLEKMIAPHEWDRFDAHMGTLDLERADLDNALGDTLAQMGGRGKDNLPSPGPSSAGSPTTETPPSQRVVSFSRGTVHEVETPEALTRRDEAAALLNY